MAVLQPTNQPRGRGLLLFVRLPLEWYVSASWKWGSDRCGSCFTGADGSRARSEIDVSCSRCVIVSAGYGAGSTTRELRSAWVVPKRPAL